MTLRTALVGFGLGGRIFHAPFIAADPGLELAAIVTDNPERIAEARAAHPGALVVHVNGSFHSAGRLGVPEHLARLDPEAEVVVVTMDRVADVEAAPAPAGDDFVILTAAE